jgi:hypothetical protein
VSWSGRCIRGIAIVILHPRIFNQPSGRLHHVAWCTAFTLGISGQGSAPPATRHPPPLNLLSATTLLLDSLVLLTDHVCAGHCSCNHTRLNCLSSAVQSGRQTAAVAQQHILERVRVSR